MRVRRTRPYVCVDVDFAEHARFQATADLDAAAGTWLRCLAHSRAQQQDGIVTQAWIRRTFADTLHRIDELVAVGLLLRRDDGDYELRAYAPRNQTFAMMEEQRESARERMSARRAALAEMRAAVTPNNGRTAAQGAEGAARSPSAEPTHWLGTKGTNGEQSPNERRTNSEQAPNEQRTNPNAIAASVEPSGSLPIHENEGSHAEAASASLGTPEPLSLLASTSPEKRSGAEELGAPLRGETSVPSDDVTANEHRTNGEQPANERRTNVFVPTSTSTSTSISSCITSSSLPLSSSDDLVNGSFSTDHVRAVPRAPVPARLPLPASERRVSGPFWLAAFSDGIREQTGRPCTGGRMYLETLERIVAHHAPQRDAPSASAWLKDQAKAFAAQWDGKHPAKGLTPDGLERWLNEGRQAPPVFGRLRIVQPPADKWHKDDWSDLGSKVDE